MIDQRPLPAGLRGEAVAEDVLREAELLAPGGDGDHRVAAHRAHGPAEGPRHVGGQIDRQPQGGEGREGVGPAASHAGRPRRGEHGAEVGLGGQQRRVRPVPEALEEQLAQALDEAAAGVAIVVRVHVQELGDARQIAPRGVLDQRGVVRLREPPRQVRPRADPRRTGKPPPARSVGGDTCPACFTSPRRRARIGETCGLRWTGRDLHGGWRGSIPRRGGVTRVRSGGRR